MIKHGLDGTQDQEGRIIKKVKENEQKERNGSQKCL